MSTGYSQYTLKSVFYKKNLAYELTVCQFHVILINLGVVECCINADVAEETLHLLNGHTFVNGHGSHGAAELVGVNVMYLGADTHGAEAAFNPSDGQAGMRRMERNEERGVIICSIA